MRPLLASAAVLLATTFAGSALADIPPPRDYVETCTVEKQQKAGETCQSCSAWHGERDACDKTLGQQGFDKRCSTHGASAWSEIWCKKSGATQPTPAEPAKPAPEPAKPAPAKPANEATTAAPAATPAKATSTFGCQGGAAPAGLAFAGLALAWLGSRRRAA